MTSRDEALALAARVEAAVNAHDIDGIARVYAPDAVLVSPVFPDVVGPAAIAKTFEIIFARFPDWRVETLDTLVDGDRVVISGVVRAVDREGWFGLPPTGERIDYRAVLLWTLAGGMIVRDERIYDVSGIVARLEKALLDRELNTAAEVQGALLSPKSFQGGHCEAVGDSLPVRTIGGDFFQFLELPSGAVGVALGDVAGKGPAAALLAAMLQGMLAVDAQSGSGPAATLARLNRAVMAKQLQTRFVTLVYGILSADGRFVYANAGHNPPIAAGRRLHPTGPVLGVFHDAEYREETLRLKAGDTIVMFSDGVTEASGDTEQEFGDERLVAYVGAHRDAPIGELLRGILGAVQRFCGNTPQTDDITVAIARLRSEVGEPLPPFQKSLR